MENQPKKRFNTEAEAIEWVRENIPFLVRRKNGNLVSPFSGGNSFDTVVEGLGKELFKEGLCKPF